MRHRKQWYDCAEDEIGLSNDHGGIIVLPGETKRGPRPQKFIKYIATGCTRLV